MSAKRFQRGHASPASHEHADMLEPRLEEIFEEFGEPAPPVAIVGASASELEQLVETVEVLDQRGIEYETHELSMARNAAMLVRFSETAALRGIRVIIAASGEAAGLPVFIAAHSDIPVIGVPLSGGPLGGLDTLLATAQTPPGVPVACMALEGAANAAVFASHILNALPLPPSDGE